jgi:hypothetical protein
LAGVDDYIIWLQKKLVSETWLGLQTFAQLCENRVTLERSWTGSRGLPGGIAQLDPSAGQARTSGLLDLALEQNLGALSPHVNPGMRDGQIYAEIKTGAGGPDRAIFRPLGACLLWTGFWKLKK